MLGNKFALLSVTAATALVLAGCESSGSTRIAGVNGNGSTPSDNGSNSGDGSNGDNGSGGSNGGNGSNGNGDDGGNDGDIADGGDGPNDDDGGLLDLANNDVLATGGIVGPDGVANTGLLANTGSPQQQSPVISNVLTESGELVNVIASEGVTIVSAVDPGLVGSDTLVGTVLGVAQDTGTALVQTGQGEQYLVDGLLAAPGELITASVGGGTLLGSADATSLVGLSVLSPDQVDGSLATVGVASDGNLINLDLSLTDGAGGLEELLGADAGDLIGNVADGLTGADDSEASPTDVVTRSLTAPKR